MADNMSDTKEKILFETNELVISLNTQVAVLTNAFNENSRKLEKFIEKVGEQHERIDTRVTLQRNDITKIETKMDNLVEDVKELKGKSNLLDFINLLVTGGVGAILYFLFGRQP